MPVCLEYLWLCVNADETDTGCWLPTFRLQIFQINQEVGTSSHVLNSRFARHSSCLYACILSLKTEAGVI